MGEGGMLEIEKGKGSALGSYAALTYLSVTGFGSNNHSVVTEIQTTLTGGFEYVFPLKPR